MTAEETIMAAQRRKKRFTVSFFLLLILLSCYLFLHSSIFNVKNIEITGLEKVSREEVLALSSISPGDKLFAVDKKLVETALKAHPLIKEAQIKRKIPHTVSISITERAVWAVVPYGDIFICIDDEGVCLDKVNNMPGYRYPIVTMDDLPKRINFGQQVEPQAIKAINKVWDRLPDSSRQAISEFHYVNKEKGMIIYTVKGTMIKFGNMERLQEKVDNFAQVIKIENEMEKQGRDVLEYVDLRFEGQPVIKTRN